MIIRTEKGKNLFSSVYAGLNRLEVSYEDTIRKNPCEYTSVARPETRDSFFTDFERMRFSELSDTYLHVPVKNKAVSFMRRTLKNIAGKQEQKPHELQYGLLFVFRSR